MKLSVNHRIIIGFGVLIVTFGVFGFIIMKNLERSRELIQHNAMVNQPSLLHLNEFNLLVINARNYTNTWLSIDISDHPDKSALSTLHQDLYPKNKDELSELMNKWELTHKDSLLSLFNQFDRIVEKQQYIMTGLGTIGAYQEFLLRVEMENLVDEVNNETTLLLGSLTNLRQQLELKIDKEEEQMLESFASIRNANIILSVIAVIIGLIVMWVTSRAVKFQAQKEVAVAERDMVQEQKEIIEEKNREILDSITYAQRIQNSILPPNHKFESAFKDHFVFYQPRDIVSGDFYWMYQLSDNELLIAAADSTGHGVPGAFVSLVCHNSLNAAVKEFGITQPSQILDKASELVQESFAQQGANVRDGMDISICKIESGKLEYAGANNSGYILRDNQWIELKACRQPVGAYENRKPFVNHSQEIIEGDKLYLFTDGFIDQFGGPKDKKYKKPNFLNLLKQDKSGSLNQQADNLNNELVTWRGKHEQVDDVLVIGIKF